MKGDPPHRTLEILLGHSYTGKQVEQARLRFVEDLVGDVRVYEREGTTFHLLETGKNTYEVVGRYYKKR